jgi:protease I
MIDTKRKIGVLFESDFYEPEIFYYKFRFAEEGYDLRLLTRLWGNPSLTFKGHEYQVGMECRDSFESIDDKALADYAAIIVPAGMVADRLRYTEDVAKLPPACEFLRRAFADKSIVKGIICHGMWLVSPVPELIRGRQAVVHNNLLGDLKNMGGLYVDQDVVVDGDLVTARTGGHCNVFAREIIDQLAKRK